MPKSCSVKTGDAVLDNDLGEYVRRILEPSRGLRAIDRIVLIALGQYADPRSGVGWPAVPTLAANIGVDPTTVREALNRLEAQGLVTRSGQRQGHGSRTYSLAQELLPRHSAAASQSDPGADDGSNSTEATGAAEAAHLAPKTKVKDKPGRTPIPPPPGKRPSEYTVVQKEIDSTKVVSTLTPTSTGYSAGNSPGGEYDRIGVDPDVAVAGFRQCVMNFAYFLADQLIERDRKKFQYRDDASSARWMGAMEKVLFDEGFPHSVAAEGLETAITSLLDSPDGEHIHEPRDLTSLRPRPRPRAGTDGLTAEDANPRPEPPALDFLRRAETDRSS